MEAGAVLEKISIPIDWAKSLKKKASLGFIDDSATALVLEGDIFPRLITHHCWISNFILR